MKLQPSSSSSSQPETFVDTSEKQVTMKMTEPAYIKLNMLDKNYTRQLESHVFKLL